MNRTKRSAHVCPPDGHHDNGRCAGFCFECGEHLLLDGRYASFCPECCPEVDECPDTTRTGEAPHS